MATDEQPPNNKSPTAEPLDRRPIKSRNTRWAEAVTEWLVRLGVSPNAISVFGCLAATIAGICFFATDRVAPFEGRLLWLIGGLLCQVRLLCNLFDGMVAIKRQIASATGELYNEVPDRISDAAVLIGLGYAAGGNEAFGYLAALLAVFVAYIRAMAKSVGAPNDFCGPMAKPQRMALVTLLAAYMAFSPAAWRFSVGELGGETFTILVLIVLGSVATAIRRLARAAKHLEGTAH